MAKKEKKVVMVPPPATELIDFRLIDEDENQPRQEFDEESIKELAADIKLHGLIQPITVRVNPDGNIMSPKELAGKTKYWIVCGARRYRASVEAGIEQIPCIVREVTDEEAFELQISENLHRKNINPMEESAAFQALVDRGISTPEMIADKFGVSVKYVYDRLLMQRVIPEVQDAIRAGRLTITHGKQFARIPLDDQKKLWEYEVEGYDQPVEVDDLKRRISQLFKLKLSSAIFDTKSKTLVKKAGACIDCQERTGCRLVMFADFEQEDVCLKPDCWNSKVNAHVDKLIVDLQKKGKKVFLLSTNWSKTEGFICNNDWGHLVLEDEEEKPIETDFVGIIRDRGDWSEYSMGQIIYLEKDPTAKSSKPGKSGSDDDNDEDDDDNEPVERRSRHLDGDEKLVIAISQSLVSTYKNFSNLFDSLNPVKGLADQCARTFNRYDLNQTNDMVIETLGIERMMDEDNAEETDYRATMLAYATKIGNEQPYNLIQLYYLLDAVEDIERLRHGFDANDYAELNEEFKPIAIDIDAIMKELTEKYGHEYPDFSVPETAE